jgi:uncharacterized OB-fold protein
MIVPVETELTAPYWAAAREGQVLLQRCAMCAQVWHPPAPVCPGCRGRDWAWFAAAGSGRLLSYTQVTHSVHAQVSAALPYVVALVELNEGPVYLCGFECGAPAEPAVGAAVTIGLGTAAGGEQLPMARLA